MILSDEDRKLLVKVYNLLGEIVETLEVLDDKELGVVLTPFERDAFTYFLAHILNRGE